MADSSGVYIFRAQFGGTVTQVGICEGLTPLEFAQTIGSALDVDFSSIVGLSVVGESAEVIPLSLACAVPSLFAGHTFEVLMARKTANLWSVPNMHQPALPAPSQPPRLTARPHGEGRFARVAPAPSHAMVAPAPMWEAAPPPKPPRPPQPLYAAKPPPPPSPPQQRQRSNSNLSAEAQEYVPRRSSSIGESKESPSPPSKGRSPPQARGSNRSSGNSSVPELSAQLQFVARLRDGGHLSLGGARSLNNALRNRDLLVLTAFDVGERAGDARHLAGLLCRLAERFEEAGGNIGRNEVLVAQSALIACARDVARRANFSASSYTQLANAVLVCPEAAVEAHEHYLTSQDPAAALNYLLRLAYGKDGQDSDAESDSEESEDAMEGKVEPEDEDSETTESSDQDDDDEEEEEAGAPEVDEYDEDYETFGEEESKTGRAKVRALGRFGNARGDSSDSEDEVSTEDEDDEYEEDFEDSSSRERSPPAQDDRRGFPPAKATEAKAGDSDEEKGEPAAGSSSSSGGEHEIGSELAAIVVRLQATLSTLQQHEAFVTDAIGTSLEEAKACLSREDRDGAVECLRRKQAYEEKLEEIKTAIGQLSAQLEEAQATGEALRSMYAEQQMLTQQEAAETAAVQQARETYAKRKSANAPDYSSSSDSSSDSSSEPDLDGEAGAAARAASEAAASKTSGDDGMNDDGEVDDGPKLASCEQAVACMAQAGLLPGEDHALLAELVEADHFIVKAAWDYYQVNPRLEELADTLVQLVRIESQRRGLEKAQADADAKAAHDEVAANAAEVKAAREASTTSATAAAAPSSGATASSEGSGPVLDAVPPLFAKVLISALDMEVLTKAQVVCFVEKFTAGDELVKAAWSIFEMQNDVKELIDTLFRIYAVYQEKETMESRYNDARAKADAASNQAAQDGNGAEEVEEEEEEEEEQEEEDPAEVDATASDEGMEQLMAILNQCMELLEKREELKAQEAAQEGGPQRPPLTPEACAAVKALGRAKDPLLIAVLADFSEKRDVEQLLNHLYVIALETQAGGAQGALDRAKAAAEEEEEEEEVKEEKYDIDRRAQQTEADSPSEGSNSLQVSVVQQMGMIVEAMLQEGLVDELEKQALEVLVLKQDPALVAAFQEFSAAQTSAQKLELLEKLSTTLRTRARQELDRLRASIAAGEDDDGPYDDDDYDDEEEEEEEDERKSREDDDDDDEFVSGGLRGVSGMSASNNASSTTNSSQESPQRHVVTITEDEDSYEESETSTDSFDPNNAGASNTSRSSSGGSGESSDPLAAMTSALASTLDHLGLPAPVKASLMACDDQGRALIIAAIDVFQQTKDVEDLKDTLKRVARHQQDAEHLASLEARLEAAEARDRAQTAAVQDMEGDTFGQ